MKIKQNASEKIGSRIKILTFAPNEKIGSRIKILTFAPNGKRKPRFTWIS